MAFELHSTISRSTDMATFTKFKIGTCNAQSLPQHWKLPSVFSSCAGLALFGMQEIDLPRYKKRAKKKWSQIIGLGPIDNNTYSCPIVYNPKRFNLLGHHSRRLYEGSDGISYTRHLTVATFEETKTRSQVGMVNLHGPVVKPDNKLAKRKECRREAQKVAREEVLNLLERGFPVVITGDFNDKDNWFNGIGTRYKMRRVGAGIDQIILFDNGVFQWEVVSKRSVDTPSDHNTLRVQVKLYQR